MANEPATPVPAPQLPEPVLPVDWFLRMPNGGGTVYARPAD